MLTYMRHSTLPPDHLAVLERALEGQLSHAVAQITQAGGDPQLHAERIQPGGNGTSEWNLLVVGAGQVHRLPVRQGIGLIAVLHVYTVDFLEDLKADLAAGLQDRQAVESMQLDRDLLWPSNLPEGVI